ncbi:MAG: hypothetical protein JNK82_03695 [Myxococcaceae bacterium]|nr:hypothetical protein [Myxococcaceae bacterium]
MPRALSKATTFPALERLTLKSDESRLQMLAPASALLRERLAAQPLSVTIATNRGPFAVAGETKKWLELATAAPGVRTLSLPGSPSLDFRRTSDGWVLELSNVAAANETVLKQVAEVKKRIIAVRPDMRSVSALAITPLRSRLKPVPVEL